MTSISVGTAVDRGREPDFSGSSLAELEDELRQVSRAIQLAGSPRGVATIESEAQALRKVAALSAHRRALEAEVKFRHAALTAWRADQDQLRALVHGDGVV
ncbi:hypothetical protein GCM10028864_29310 [Microlunatus parietis]